MKSLSPQVAAWYQDLSTGNLFEVVAIDEQSETIEYQMLDGEIGETDQSGWKAMQLVAIEAPEDWRSPYEISDDIGTDDRAQIPENLSGVLAEFEPELIDFGEDFNLFEPPL